MTFLHLPLHLFVSYFRAIQQSLKDYQAYNLKASQNEDHPGSDNNVFKSEEKPKSENCMTIANGYICDDSHDTINSTDFARDIELALRLSKEEQEKQDRQQKEEEEMLNLILELSKKEL
jgi:hypothetical protein